jgi:hypothetical protein
MDMAKQVQDLTWWHTNLMCGIEHLSYDFVGKVAVLRLPEGHCVDMDGAIKFVKRIDPQVRRIETWSGSEVDTLYVRMDEMAGKPVGKWRACEQGRGPNLDRPT